MKMSAKGLQFLKDVEGVVLHVYRDSAGLPTIGIGHLLTHEENVGNKYANGITLEEALQILASDVTPAENRVNALVKVPLTQNQFDTLVSFAFNVGTGAFASSTLLRNLNAGCYDQVPTQLARWNKVSGKVCDGLITRRNNEIKLWNGAV